MIVRSVYRQFRRSLLHRFIDTGAVHAATKWDHVTIFGYLTLAVGLGEGARLCAEALATEPDLVVGGLDVGPSVGKRREQDWALPAGPGRAGPAHGVGLWHLNPPMMPPAVFWFGRRRYARQVNLGYWAWEFDSLPDEWVKALRYVNAVLVPSEFTARAVRARTDKPVLVVPHPVPAPEPDADGRHAMRARLGLRPADTLACCVFSFGSSMERKNPMAAIRGARMAWGDDPGATLVIKTAHGDQHPEQKAALLAAIGGAANIRLVDEIWSRAEIAALIGASQAFLSLHRTEGFGINILEAILAGTPVVTTGWSGNLDFCAPEAVDLVAFRPLALTPAQARGFDLPGGHWADPDAEHAAACLKALRADPGQARRRAEHARAFALAHLRDRTYRAALDEVRHQLDLTPGSGSRHTGTTAAPPS